MERAETSEAPTHAAQPPAAPALPPERKGYVAGRVEDLPPGSVTLLPIGKFGIGLYNIKGRYYAVTNYCSHRGGPVCVGPTVPKYESEEPYQISTSRDGEYLRCPWHGWDYELASGQALVADKKLRTHSVIVEDGDVIVLGV